MFKIEGFSDNESMHSAVRIFSNMLAAIKDNQLSVIQFLFAKYLYLTALQKIMPRKLKLRSKCKLKHLQSGE